jgi:hypothetical protein
MATQMRGVRARAHHLTLTCPAWCWCLLLLMAFVVSLVGMSCVLWTQAWALDHLHKRLEQPYTTRDDVRAIIDARDRDLAEKAFQKEALAYFTSDVTAETSVNNIMGPLH